VWNGATLKALGYQSIRKPNDLGIYPAANADNEAIRHFRASRDSLRSQCSAEPKDKDKDKPPKDKDKDNGAVYSLPDTGSTVLLLGSALLVLGVASRRLATR
jgi:hypothetical protein